MKHNTLIFFFLIIVIWIDIVTFSIIIAQLYEIHKDLFV